MSGGGTQHNGSSGACSDDSSGGIDDEASNGTCAHSASGGGDDNPVFDELELHDGAARERELYIINLNGEGAVGPGFGVGEREVVVLLGDRVGLILNHWLVNSSGSFTGMEINSRSYHEVPMIVYAANDVDERRKISLGHFDLVVQDKVGILPVA